MYRQNDTFCDLISLKLGVLLCNQQSINEEKFCYSSFKAACPIITLRTNDVLDYKMSGNTIILEKVSSIPELTVEDLFKDYEGEPVN